MASKKKTGLGSDPLNWIGSGDKKKKATPKKASGKKQKSEVQEEKKTATNIVNGKEILLVSLDSIVPDPQQPRKGIDAKSSDIKELAESLKKHGFINFITVKANPAGGYIVVAGERRFTAAKVAGFEEIPVMVIAEDMEPEDYALIQLEENMQRIELTAFEEANTYIRLQQEFGLQQKEVAQRTRKSKSYISRMMKFSGISEGIREEVLTAPREVLFELATFPDEQQEVIWEKIRETPTISSFEKVKKRLEKQQEKKKEKPDEPERPDPEVVFEALKRAMKKDKNMLFEFLTPKKVERLLGEFGE